VASLIFDDDDDFLPVLSSNYW